MLNPGGRPKHKGTHAYLDSGTSDDAHEEIGDDTRNGHHQALNDSDAGIKTQHKEEIMLKARVKAHHEVTNCPRNEGDQYKEWHCRYRVADHKCCHTIVTVHPFPLKNLHVFDKGRKSTDRHKCHKPKYERCT